MELVKTILTHVSGMLDEHSTATLRQEIGIALRLIDGMKYGAAEALEIMFGGTDGDAAAKEEPEC